jgi:hypothetical protein
VKADKRRRPRRRGSRAGRPSRAPAAEAPLPLPPPPPDPAPAELVAEIEGPPVELPAPPEGGFAARVPPPAPPRPLPATRRAIFFDVENASRPEHVMRVMDYLNVDRIDRQTDLVAVGNWRVASSECARLLARSGAQLVHSAPSTGVRDWSDLRIAVSAGVWLASARPGDTIEIVSDDRAFDAVGDVAAALGVGYRRLSFRSLAGLPGGEVVRVEETAEPRGRYRRRGRHGRGRPERDGRPSPSPVPARVHHEPVHHAAPRAHHEAAAEAHTAPHDEIVGVARELIDASDRRAVTIDTLANALKERGFRRTPGSPRLITRLRRIKELEISRNGLITLTAGTAPAAHLTEPVPEPEPEPVAEDAAESPAEGEAMPTPSEGAGEAPRRPRRRGRRGGRRHRRRAPEAAAASE